MAVPDADQIHPKSSHVSDPSFSPFLQKSFDPAEYLNSTLPSLSISTSTKQPGPSGSLAQVSAQTQTLLSTLNAQTSRLSTTLTHMTDDILRSGGRLAYQVEVLRGETIGLTDALADTLKDDARLFTPAENQSSKTAEEGGDNAEEDTSLPPYIRQLKMLTQVRSRLEAVIKVFGEAMQWTIPPSEVSIASSFISVSGPEPGADSQSREEKGKEFAERLRSEIADLIVGTDGHTAAIERINALRDLSMVWKGTSEEKARTRFVDGLVKLAEERAKAIEKDASRQRQGNGGAVSSPVKGPTRPAGGERTSTSGFLENLQKIRNGIYLE